MLGVTHLNKVLKAKASITWVKIVLYSLNLSLKNKGVITTRRQLKLSTSKIRFTCIFQNLSTKAKINKHSCT